MTGTGVTGISDDWYRRTMGVIVISCKHVGALERTLGTPGSVSELMWKSQTNSERGQGSYRYSCRGLQVLSETLRMSTSNQFPSIANMMHGSLFIINSESYWLPSSSTLYLLPHYNMVPKTKASDSNINTGTPTQ
jgi:hypothetical protein